MVTGIKHCSYSVVSTKKGFNTGKHKWSIKFIEIGHRHSNPGVITNITNLASVGRGYHHLKNSQGSRCCGYLYIWHDFDSALHGYHNGILTVNQDNWFDKIEVNDVITMILDCQNWIIAFLRNDKYVGSMKLPPNQTYYPCLYTCACTSQQYELVSGQNEVYTVC